MSHELHYRQGTLELSGFSAELAPPGDFWEWDGRSRSYRAPAFHYADAILGLRAESISIVDHARGYAEIDLTLRVDRQPRPYQSEAIDAFRASRYRGLVVLPTGAGKTYVAVMAMASRCRSTLVIAPTLNLVHQWYDVLRRSFGREIGIIGGGDYRLEDITVTTYDSAYLHMDRLGHRFGMLIFDECHHLPSESFSLIAKMSTAPFRLGLTATPERSDGREALLESLVGPVCYRRDIIELAGEYLADYEVETIRVQLSEAERLAYDEARSVYLAYLRSTGIKMNSPAAWQQFVMRASRNEAGQQAMENYRLQRALALAAPAKLDAVEMLLEQHAQDQSIIFTQDNASAYEISRRFLIPVITHHSKVSERAQILDGLAENRYTAVVTSKVLNEGVDVPSANVAIVVSGSGSVREHVQRLGRILRPQPGKRAKLYELVTENTTEQSTSKRRRDHSAYR